MEIVSAQKNINKKEVASSTMDLVIHAFCFISVLLIGADIWGLDVGVNLRYDQVFLGILTILLVINQKYRLHGIRGLRSFLWQVLSPHYLL